MRRERIGGNKMKEAPKGRSFLGSFPFGGYGNKGGKYAWEFYGC
jgi:hypothetical protein